MYNLNKEFRRIIKEYQGHYPKSHWSYNKEREYLRNIKNFNFKINRIYDYSNVQPNKELDILDDKISNKKFYHFKNLVDFFMDEAKKLNINPEIYKGEIDENSIDLAFWLDKEWARLQINYIGNGNIYDLLHSGNKYFEKEIEDYCDIQKYFDDEDRRMRSTDAYIYGYDTPEDLAADEHMKYKGVDMKKFFKELNDNKITFGVKKFNVFPENKTKSSFLNSLTNKKFNSIEDLYNTIKNNLGKESFALINSYLVLIYEDYQNKNFIEIKIQNDNKYYMYILEDICDDNITVEKRLRLLKLLNQINAKAGSNEHALSNFAENLVFKKRSKEIENGDLNEEYRRIIKEYQELGPEDWPSLNLEAQEDVLLNMKDIFESEFNLTCKISDKNAIHCLICDDGNNKFAIWFDHDDHENFNAAIVLGSNWFEFLTLKTYEFNKLASQSLKRLCYKIFKKYEES